MTQDVQRGNRASDEPLRPWPGWGRIARRATLVLVVLELVLVAANPSLLRNVDSDPLVRIFRPPPRIGIGERIAPIHPAFKSGWAAQEPWGRWTVGQVAEVVFRIPKPTRDVRLEVEVHQSLQPRGGVHSYPVTLAVNGVELLRTVVTGPSHREVLGVTVPKSVVADGEVALTIGIENIRSPVLFGTGVDAKPYAIGVAGLIVK